LYIDIKLTFSMMLTNRSNFCFLGAS